MPEGCAAGVAQAEISPERNFSKHIVDNSVNVVFPYLPHATHQWPRERDMQTSRFQSRIRANDGRFYAVIVRIDRDGEEAVVMSRHYASRKAAEKSTAAYIAKVSA